MPQKRPNIPTGLCQLLYSVWQTWPQRCVLEGHGELGSLCPWRNIRPLLLLLFLSFRPFCYRLAGNHWTKQSWNLCLLEISRSYSGFLVTLCVQDAAVASLFTSILLEPLGHLGWDFYVIILSSVRGIRGKIRLLIPHLSQNTNCGSNGSAKEYLRSFIMWVHIQHN